MSKTIFITGASRGFGRIWTEAFLKRGDKVAATARDLNSLKELSPLYFLSPSIRFLKRFQYKPWIRQFVRDFTAFNGHLYSPQSLLDF